MPADVEKEASGLLSLTLKSGEEKRLLRGHPWVFSNELKAVPKDVELGVLAVLETAKGRRLGGLPCIGRPGRDPSSLPPRLATTQRREPRSSLPSLRSLAGNQHGAVPSPRGVRPYGRVAWT